MSNAHTSTGTELITFGRDAFVAQLLNSTCGNVSLRLDDETMLISGTGTRVQDLSLEQLSTVRIADGAILAGPAASMEASMHRQVYALRPQVGAVLHCQSFAATLLACHHTPPDNLDLIPEVPAYVRRHAYVPWAMAGSEALAVLVAEALADPDVTVVQMTNHGQLICGADAAAVLRRGVFFEFACSLWAQGGETLRTIPTTDAEGLRAYGRGA